MRNSRIYNIDMVRGDTLSFGFEVDGIDNLDTAFFTCKKNADDSEVLFQKSLGNGIYAAENGKYGVRIAPENTQNIDPGLYYYDVEIGVNGDIFTILQGRLKIVQDTTTRGDRKPASITAEWGNITGDLSAQSDLSTSLNEKANTADLSTVATSGSYADLTNKPSIPSKTSDLTNDSNFVVSTDLAGVATSGSYTDLSDKPNLSTVATSGSYSDLSNKPNLSTVATSGSYADLSNKPSIPSKTSDLTNDSNFVVSSSLSTVATSGSYADLTNKPNLATVATSGSYADLTNKPSIPSKTSDLTNDSNFVASSDLSSVATSGSYNDLSNKPNLATVATSGAYSDLTNKPTIPTLASIVDLIYPVGSYYWNSNSTSPATLFGVGTWTQITNRFIYAAGGDYASGDTGGEETHVLTITEIPSHRHRLLDYNAAGSANIIVTHLNGWEMEGGPAQGEGNSVGLRDLFSAYSGSGNSHNNMPPYIVAYCWRRDA